MKDAYPYYLDNQAVFASDHSLVTDKYTGDAAFRVAQADPTAIDRAIAVASEAEHRCRRWPAHHRRKALLGIASGIANRLEEFAQVLCIEAGKPIRDSRVEVNRAVETFQVAAEEAGRTTCAWLPLDASPRGEGYQAISRRFPVGPCSFITPFNFPLNLVAHKVAPAIAMGCPFVLKPAPQAPVAALMLGELLAAAELPQGSFAIVPCDIAHAAPLVQDDRIKLLSFTGSAKVGWQLKQQARKKKVVLELGGNAACIVDEGADLAFAAKRIAFGAFYQSGQSCISVQRLLVHQSAYQQLVPMLIREASAMKWGNPRDEQVTLGPLISEADVDRIHSWVNQAVDAGAKTLCGGKPIERRFFQATILENVPHSLPLYCEEAFGPVMTIEPFSRFDQACQTVNDSRYGLQAGVFTPSLNHALHAFEELAAGGVIINDVPSFRIDSMPYGGVKDSGTGREGVRYAMDEMSEIKLMVLKGPNSLT